MSGKPHPDGVKRVRELLDNEAQLRDEAVQLKRTIDAAKKRLAMVDDEYGRACTERTKLMAQMDLTSSGNYGYEERMSWFLVELVRQTKEAAPERVVQAVDVK